MPGAREGAAAEGAVGAVAAEGPVTPWSSVIQATPFLPRVPVSLVVLGRVCYQLLPSLSQEPGRTPPPQGSFPSGPCCFSGRGAAFWCAPPSPAAPPQPLRLPRAHSMQLELLGHLWPCVCPPRSPRATVWEHAEFSPASVPLSVVSSSCLSPAGLGGPLTRLTLDRATRFPPVCPRGAWHRGGPARAPRRLRSSQQPRLGTLPLPRPLSAPGPAQLRLPSGCQAFRRLWAVSKLGLK